MKIAKIVLGGVVAVILAMGSTAIVARVSDGPIGIFPGGPLADGPEVDRYIVGWGFARNADTIEMQLVGDDTSRTTWFIEHEARGYIPASVSFPPGKSWHLRADGSEAWLRIEGQRYHVRLDRVEDPAITQALGNKIKVKYGTAPSGEAWWFKVHSLAPIPM